jgi:hypothetical protein
LAWLLKSFEKAGALLSSPLEELEHLKSSFGRAGALESQITVPPDLKPALASIIHQNSSST